MFEYDILFLIKSQLNSESIDRINLLHFVIGRGNLKQKELNEEHLWQNRN